MKKTSSSYAKPRGCERMCSEIAPRIWFKRCERRRRIKLEVYIEKRSKQFEEKRENEQADVEDVSDAKPS